MDFRKRERGYEVPPDAVENRKRRRADSEDSISSLDSADDNDEVGHLRINPGEYLTDRCEFSGFAATCSVIRFVIMAVDCQMLAPLCFLAELQSHLPCRHCRS